MPHAFVNVLQQGLREYSWLQGAVMATLCTWVGIKESMVRAMHLNSFVTRFSADPRTHSAPIYWGLLSCWELEGPESFLCEEFGRKFWRRRVVWIKLRATFAFSRFTSLVALMSPSIVFTEWAEKYNILMSAGQHLISFRVACRLFKSVSCSQAYGCKSASELLNQLAHQRGAQV